MDFQFLRNNISKDWVVLAPKRARRPDHKPGGKAACPFCVGNEGRDEVYRVPSKPDLSWQVRVIKNKFPFAAIHEVVILSPSHTKGLTELENSQIELVLGVYRHRFNEHHGQGNVVIFHNNGIEAGESLVHPHSQIVAVPFKARIDAPELEAGLFGLRGLDRLEIGSFQLFCPTESSWPDEVWLSPLQVKKQVFGEATDGQLTELAVILKKLLQLMEKRHHEVFPYNFYIYPGESWYLRLIPRLKKIGGFEFATNIFVNTQDPRETFSFLKKNFGNFDPEKVRREHQADYHHTA